MSDPRITDEAVEAAARAMFDITWRGGDWTWPEYPAGSNPWIPRARTALEAALPHLAPHLPNRHGETVEVEALAQAVAGHTRSEMYRGSEAEWWCPCGNWRTYDINEAVYGHARHVADLVLALLNGGAK